jgi:translation initiation factor IF-3
MRVNQEIRAREVRVIGDGGEQLGIMQLRDAQRMADEKERDLVEISPTADPPVCRMMDYGRFKYEQSKKDREARANRKIVELREVTMRPKIDEHDFQVKHRMARRLLEDGDKVKVTVRFRGREMAHPELAFGLLERLHQELTQLAVQERAPRMEGRFMHMILAPRENVLLAMAAEKAGAGGDKAATGEKAPTDDKAAAAEKPAAAADKPAPKPAAKSEKPATADKAAPAEKPAAAAAPRKAREPQPQSPA